jgi:hypothetical protein
MSLRQSNSFGQFLNGGELTGIQEVFIMTPAAVDL